MSAATAAVAIEEVAAWAWRASWQGAVLAVVVAVVLKVVGRRLSPGWRFGLWGLVLVRMGVPAVVEVSWWGRGGAGGAATEKAEHRTFNIEHRTSKEIRPSRLPARTGVESVGEGRPMAPSGEGEAIRKVGTSPAVTAPSWNWQRARVWATWAWMGGVVVLAGRVVWASARLARVVRRMAVVTEPGVVEVLQACCAEAGVRRVPVVRLLPAGGGPALVGFWRPAVLLPPAVVGGMAGDPLRLILLHELGHVRRWDVLVNWLGALVAVVHWPNPAAWLVLGRMRYERELACDEFVLRVGQGTADRGAYARTIVGLAEALSVGGGRGVAAAGGAGLVGILEGRTQLQRRLQMIARFDATGRRWPVVAAGLGIVIGAAALSGVTRAADEPKPEPVRPPAVGAPAVETAAKATRPSAPLSPRAKKTLAGLLDRPAPPSDADVKEAMQPLWDDYRKKQIIVGGQATNTDQLLAEYRADQAGITRAIEAAKEQGHWAPKAASPVVGEGPAPTPIAPPAAKSPVPAKEGRVVDEGDPANGRTAEKLQKPVKVDFQNNAFADVLDFVRDQAGVDILVQWAQLEAAGFDRNAPVTLRLREPTPVGSVLSLIFRTLPVRLNYEIDKGVVVIGTAEPVAAGAAPEVTRVYDVSDLVMFRGEVPPPGVPVGPGGFGGGGGGGQPMAVVVPDEVAQLTRLIQTTVQPDSWREAGGASGSITSFKGKLVIKATEPVHKEVAQLLEMLRETPGARKAERPK